MDITDNIWDDLSIEARWMRIIISFKNGYRIDFVSLCSWRPMLSIPVIMLRRLLCFRTQLWYIWQNENKKTQPNRFVLLSFRHRLEGQWDWNFSMSMNLNLNQTHVASMCFKKTWHERLRRTEKNYLFCFEYHVELLERNTMYWCIALFLTRYNKQKINK